MWVFHLVLRKIFWVLVFERDVELVTEGLRDPPTFIIIIIIILISRSLYVNNIFYYDLLYTLPSR